MRGLAGVPYGEVHVGHAGDGKVVGNRLLVCFSNCHTLEHDFGSHAVQPLGDLVRNMYSLEL